MNPTHLTSHYTPQISLIVPVYKEEANIRPFLQRTEAVFLKMSVTYEIIFALDPSPDKTEEIILEEINRNSNIKLMVFSRRFGQPAATMAGILSCTGETCVVIDVDLQDQPELIEQMFAKLQEGYEVVCAKRRSRKGETLIKRVIAHLGYGLINKLSDVEIPRNTGDFRIMTRRVIEELRRLNECHGFLRGLVAYVGFKQAFIEYDRDERYAGTGNYNRFTGSFKIGLNGLISFSSKPLFVMSISGFILAGLSFLIGAWYVFQKMIGIDITPGLPTTVLIISFFAGVQLLGLGLIGEYVGRIYDEVKRRPMCIIDRRINFKDEK
ncbi:glycosyltransferase family 2 protein [Yersinia mollaretii]|uniref:Glycosyltransferase family 2 protein n=1 Tax=Yersinia mollaretii TaxID=33060 RepID=A0AA44CJM3_YERMO|nr:glycosyltransferase family 2 protein [Yersinia mollaretii]NIL21934.1 glycosyltransferase family 2 protein [Yersinia mollaretii]CNI15624.1 undecaprenyl phosphate 4-deoxy-4-formamido-L-arabinose transferase [Yersinia mollaretii]CQQ20814.1 undecaprenyl phosphate 4-deoxy-4-formamido-L-arabinose transferase [Yersinia mollaretii]